MIFLGTGAAELIPDPFCDCEICRYALLHPEEQRMRSSFLYDSSLCIDCGPDTPSQANRYGVSLLGVKDFLITHTHGDHLCLENLSLLSCNSVKPHNMFTVHISEKGYEWLQKSRDSLFAVTGGENDLFSCVKREYYQFVTHKPFESFMLGDKEILPVYGFHHGNTRGETCFNYRIKQNGKSLLYALDTGTYPEESIEALQGEALDILILDATFGLHRLTPQDGHHDAWSFVSDLERFYKAGIIDSGTKIYATHINHHGKVLHNQYQEFFDKNSPFSVTVARDGMKIERGV